jgi:hypothetical protein
VRAHGGSLAVAAARAYGVYTMSTSGGHVFDARQEQTAVAVRSPGAMMP